LALALCPVQPRHLPLGQVRFFPGHSIVGRALLCTGKAYGSTSSDHDHAETQDDRRARATYSQVKMRGETRSTHAGLLVARGTRKGNPDARTDTSNFSAQNCQKKVACTLPAFAIPQGPHRSRSSKKVRSNLEGEVPCTPESGHPAVNLAFFAALVRNHTELPCTH
jgi:hypothetical protein